MTYRHTKNLTELCARLRKFGIAIIDIDYDGSGDSGCINDVQALDATNAPIVLSDEPVSITLIESVWSQAKKRYVEQTTTRDVKLKDAIEEWCYDILEHHFPGWEIDDGSCGTATLDIAKGAGRLRHGTRVIETVDAEVEV